MDKKTVLCFGDSWTGGHKIDPKLEDVIDPGYFTHPLNDEYRLPKLFPWFLEKTGEFEEVLNLGFPGGSNDAIVRRMIEYISLHHLKQGMSTDNIMVIIGWSSPCRREFLIEYDNNYWIEETLWVNVHKEHSYSPEMQEMYKLFLKYFWNDTDVLRRYIYHCIQAATFLKSHNIKCFMFNAFYEFPQTIIHEENKKILEIKDDNIRTAKKFIKRMSDKFFGEEKGKANIGAFRYGTGTLDKINTLAPHDIDIWKANVPEHIYYGGHNLSSSFYKFLGDKINDKKYYAEFHPTKEGHKLWADELMKVMRENKII